MAQSSLEQFSVNVSSHRHRILLLAVACSVAPLTRAQTSLSAKQIAEIRALGADTLTKDNLPGLSIAIAEDDQVWTAAFGSADLEQNVPVDSHTLFRTASITKWMTATAAMRLADEGKLNIDAPIQQYCPQYPVKQWPITSRELLSQLSGIRHYHGANGEPRDTAAQRDALDALVKREQSTQYTRYTEVAPTLDAFKDDPLIYQPGTHFLYSSLGYRVMGCVLEGAAQMPYRALMRNLVFTPAGMSTITEDDAQIITPHRVAGYAWDENKHLIRAPFRDVSENLPGGGDLANPQDLVRFAIAFNSGKLVQPKTRDLMIERPKLIDGSPAPDAPNYFGMGSGLYYGLGIFVGKSATGERLLMHTGRDPGASTELLLAPDSSIAIAVMSNVSQWDGTDTLAKKILEIVGRNN
jgi:serine beta-lactamase-like protein LACTB, mitochondrial